MNESNPREQDIRRFFDAALTAALAYAVSEFDHYRSLIRERDETIALLEQEVSQLRFRLASRAAQKSADPAGAREGV